MSSSLPHALPPPPPLLPLVGSADGKHLGQIWRWNTPCSTPQTLYKTWHDMHIIWVTQQVVITPPSSPPHTLHQQNPCCSFVQNFATFAQNATEWWWLRPALTPRGDSSSTDSDAASWCVLQHLHRLQHSWRSLGLKRVLSPDLIPLIAFLKLLMPILGKPGQVHGRLLGWSQIKSRNVFTSSCVGATRTSGATKTTSTSTKRAVTSLMSIISVCGERERLTHPFSFFTQNPPKCPNRNEWTESLAPVPLMLRRGMRTGRLAAPNTPSCVPLETASVWRQHRGGLWMGGRSPGQEVSLLSCSTV